MKIKNITSSIRNVKDLLTGETIMVNPNEIVEFKKAEFNTTQFNVIETKTETKTETKETKITEKEVI